ncbi:hypothetical protein [Bacteroides sp.]|uniref:hypothetical protein n=1 Tax=Bacteroides sp. TaxID=29523 RepID=UPI003AB1A143
MQKNYSQSERYARGINRNVKGNLAAGIIILFVMIIVHLVSGCEPILPNEPRELSNEVDSIQEKEEIVPGQEIDDWDTDTTIYHTTAQPN